MDASDLDGKKVSYEVMVLSLTGQVLVPVVQFV